MADRKNMSDKELRNERFDRGELGALLRLFSSLGVTVAAGIVGFFLLGIYAERKAAEFGYPTGGVLRVAVLLVGLGLSVYWAYLRIVKHLDKYDHSGNSKR